MGFLIVCISATLCTVPSSLIAKWLMRRRGQDLSWVDAPLALMDVGHPAEKLVLISLNFAIAGTALYLIAKS